MDKDTIQELKAGLNVLQPIEQQLKAESKEAQDKFKSEIKTYVSNPKFKKIKRFIKSILHSDRKHLLIVSGSGGQGKSFSVQGILKELNTDFHYCSVHSSPLSLYESLFHHKEEVILIDDSENILRTDNCIAILKSATETKSERLVEWNTTSEKLKAPNSFLFKGKIIILTNIPLDHIDIPLKSRAIKTEIKTSYTEMIRLMPNILKHNFKDKLTLLQIAEVMRFIQDYTNELTEEFDFRLITGIADLYLTLERHEFDDTAMELIRSDNKLEICLQAVKMHPEKIAEQIKFYVTETGRSRRSFYNAKKILKERGITYGLCKSAICANRDTFATTSQMDSKNKDLVRISAVNSVSAFNCITNQNLIGGIENGQTERK